MKKTNNLAIDAKFTELEEAEKYSQMIQYAFGNRTFSLNTLRTAMCDQISVSPFSLKVLKSNFDLPNSCFVAFTNEDLELAIKALKTLNDIYKFLTVSEIDYLLTKAKDLNQLNDRVLNDSSLFRDWEVKIKDLPLSPRIKNALIRQGINTINDLSDYGFSEKNMIKIRNLGLLSLDKLRRVIEPYGLILQ